MARTPVKRTWGRTAQPRLGWCQRGPAYWCHSHTPAYWCHWASRFCAPPRSASAGRVEDSGRVVTWLKVEMRELPCVSRRHTRPVSYARRAVQGERLGCAARSSRSLARSLSSAAHAGILVPVYPLARSLALRSLACSPLARSLALRSLARSLTSTHRRSGVTVRHDLLRTARSLASSPLNRSLSARSPLARSLALWLPHSHTPIHWCHPSARYSGDIPNKLQLPCQCCLVE